ncbi:MAG: ImmA/IrrE family metallo-endopeptidase [Ahrensia sp.]
MSKFRLKMARQLGEKKALDHGFDSFPINPFKIASDEEIIVEAKQPEKEGMSGCIVFNDDGVGIIYSTSIPSEGFQNFTVAHELGHYFIDGHPDEILKTGPMHVSRAGFSQGDSSIEIEADHFASGLLMPTTLVKKQLQRSPIGLEAIRALATVSKSSLTAAAIRTAECAPYPMAIVVSSGQQVCYAFISDAFKNLGRLRFLRKGDLLPASGTSDFNRDASRILSGDSMCVECKLASWFEGPKHITLDEEIVGLGRYGLTLTVLSSEEITEDPYEDEDEDEKLENSWTPRFAYGR